MISRNKNTKTKKILRLIIISCLFASTTINIFSKHTSAMTNIILFTAEDGSTGKYWPSDSTAILGEKEYSKVVAIDIKQLNCKSAKKLKKHKDYLGVYMDKQSQKTFYVYGIIKNPIQADDSPDADVLTEIAIKIDYGPGE